MTKDEIMTASKTALQTRWVYIMNIRETWLPEKNELRREWLMIGVRLALLRGDTDRAAELAIELKETYNESLKED